MTDSPKTTHSEDWEKEFRHRFQLPEIEPLVDFIRETCTAAYESGRSDAVKYIQKNIVSIDKNPVESGTLELDIYEFADLLERARLLDT